MSRGAAALVQALVSLGTRRVFTLSGNHVMSIYDAAIGSGIELVHVRHEAAAVHMADAWARLTGEVGVALVTGGPGHANAVGALYTAAMAESPVVLLSGHAPLSQLGRGAFQEMRQADIATPLCKASWTCWGFVARDIARAFSIARESPEGPVHVSLPTDLLEGHAEATNAKPPPESPAPIDVGPHVESLRKASRPLVLCGPAWMRKRLHETRGAIPIVGMESPRGVADPSLGAFASVLRRADAVLLLGKRLDFTLKFGKALAPGCHVMNVHAGDVDLAGLCEGPASAWAMEVRSAIDHRPRQWEVWPTVRTLRAIQPLLDSHAGSVFVCDGGEFGQWAQAYLTAPHRLINGMAGSIGASLPFAVAASMAKPGVPVVAVMGDGTFGFHPAEIDTAARYGAPFVAIVGNDARWNAEYQIQRREYGRTVATELAPTAYHEVAKGFGGHGELVERPEDLPAALDRAAKSRKPAVLNVLIEGRPAPEISFPA